MPVPDLPAGDPPEPVGRPRVVRGGTGTAVVGGHDEVDAGRIAEYHALGLSLRERGLLEADDSARELVTA